MRHPPINHNGFDAISPSHPLADHPIVPVTATGAADCRQVPVGAFRHGCPQNILSLAIRRGSGGFGNRPSEPLRNANVVLSFAVSHVPHLSFLNHARDREAALNQAIVPPLRISPPYGTKFATKNDGVNRLR